MATDCEVSIVGVSCRFAGVSDPSAFWRLIMERRNSFRPLPDDVAIPFGAHNLFERPYPTHIASLDSLYACVPIDQVFPPHVNAGENQDLYFGTQLAIDALRNAGMRPRSNILVRGSVRLGYAPPFNGPTINWLQHTFFIDQTMELLHRFFPTSLESDLEDIRGQLVKSLPPPDSDSLLAGSGHRVARHIAEACSFSGGVSAINSGTISCVSALETAMDDLRADRTDVALVGSFTPPLYREFLMGVSGLWTFSEGDAMYPFDKDSSGMIPGEGGAFFVLKRREDALRARDRIYANVKSISSGAKPLEEILVEAASGAGVDVRNIGLVEADGSGVPALDAEEARAIRNLWGDHQPGGPLVGVGSVKGNIGHCMRASASASILKVALALNSKILPPQVPVVHPLEDLSSPTSPAYLIDRVRPWIHGDSEHKRLAAVFVRELSGVNAAVILEEERSGR